MLPFAVCLQCTEDSPFLARRPTKYPDVAMTKPPVTLHYHGPKLTESLQRGNLPKAIDEPTPS